MDEVMKGEGAALRKGNGSAEGIFKAVSEIERKVEKVRLLGQVKGEHWLDAWGRKRRDVTIAD